MIMRSSMYKAWKVLKMFKLRVSDINAFLSHFLSNNKLTMSLFSQFMGYYKIKLRHFLVFALVYFFVCAHTGNEVNSIQEQLCILRSSQKVSKDKHKPNEGQKIRTS